MLWPVQLLRGVAAVMVVIGHSQTAIARMAFAQGRDFHRWTGLPWGASVDLFFVISGFIIVYSSHNLFGRKGARLEFLIRRSARVLPLYWLCTTIYVALLVVVAIRSETAPPTPGAIISSYMFLPFGGNTGEIMPIFGVGWTLNYEMAFYLLFALCIGLGRWRATLAVLGILLAAAIAGGALRSAPAPILFWTRPIIADFGLGMIVGTMCRRGITLPAALRVGAIVSGAILFCADPLSVFDVSLGETVANGWPRMLFAGIPAALVMAGIVLGPQRPMPGVLRPAAMIGDSSYSLYLTHPFMLILMEKLLQKLPSLGLASPGAMVVAVVMAAIVAALFVFRWVEQPLTIAAERLLRSNMQDRKSRKTALRAKLTS